MARRRRQPPGERRDRGICSAELGRPARRPRDARGGVVGGLDRGARGSGPGARAGDRASCTACCCARRRFELARRREALAHVRGEELDDLAIQAADDALMAVLSKARRLPRREPLHHLGLQVRAARGRGEAAAPRLAGPRGGARARGLERVRRSAGDPLQEAARERASCSTPCGRRSTTRSPPISAGCSSPWRSTRCRSTSSPSGSRPPAARSTRPFTTPAARLRASARRAGAGAGRRRAEGGLR